MDLSQLKAIDTALAKGGRSNYSDIAYEKVITHPFNKHGNECLCSKPQQLVALGDSCMREYDFFHAIQHYQQAQQIRKENKVRLKLAECFYQRNDYHGCSDVLDKVPSDSLNHNALRQLYYSNSAMKNTSEQLYWGTYIKIRYPMDSKIIADVMGLLVSDSYDKPEVAVSYGQDYCLIDSTNIEVNRALGEAYFLNKDYERCVATYQKALC